jgi:hypothetical protein
VTGTSDRDARGADPDAGGSRPEPGSGDGGHRDGLVDHRPAGTSSPGADREPERNGDVSDIIEGEIGSASLKEPTDARRHAADLDRLPRLGQHG